MRLLNGRLLPLLYNWTNLKIAAKEHLGSAPIKDKLLPLLKKNLQVEHLGSAPIKDRLLSLLKKHWSNLKRAPSEALWQCNT